MSFTIITNLLVHRTLSNPGQYWLKESCISKNVKKFNSLFDDSGFSLRNGKNRKFSIFSMLWCRTRRLQLYFSVQQTVGKRGALCNNCWNIGEIETLSKTCHRYEHTCTMPNLSLLNIFHLFAFLMHSTTINFCGKLLKLEKFKLCSLMSFNLRKAARYISVS